MYSSEDGDNLRLVVEKIGKRKVLRHRAFNVIGYNQSASGALAAAGALGTWLALGHTTTPEGWVALATTRYLAVAGGVNETHTMGADRARGGGGRRAMRTFAAGTGTAVSASGCTLNRTSLGGVEGLVGRSLQF